MVVCPKDTREGKTTHRYFSSSNFDIRHQCSGKKRERTNLGSTGALACRLAAQFKARSAPGQDTRSGTRGSRSQTHRRAAMGGFTQDDGYVQGVAPMHWVDAPRIPFWTSSNFCDFSSSGRCVPKTYQYRYFANTV